MTKTQLVSLPDVRAGPSPIIIGTPPPYVPSSLGTLPWVFIADFDFTCAVPGRVNFGTLFGAGYNVPIPVPPPHSAPFLERYGLFHLRRAVELQSQVT